MLLEIAIAVGLIASTFAVSRILSEILALQARVDALREEGRDRYIDLLEKLTLIRNQNFALMRWAERQQAIAAHEATGRPDIVQELKTRSLFDPEHVPEPLKYQQDPTT